MKWHFDIFYRLGKANSLFVEKLSIMRAIVIQFHWAIIVNKKRHVIMGDQSTICLNLIVKNESSVITRCLESVANYIDCWVISDTGSTDGTQKIITSFFKKRGIPGVLTEDAWVDFSHNRNIALNNAKNKADYIFMMDADDYLLAPDDFSFGSLTCEMYNLPVLRGNISYYFHKLIRADLDWQWEGVLHEYLVLSSSYKIENIQALTVISTSDGDRSQNKDKFKNDIKVLSQALEKNPENARYQFYLAQSYHDDGDFEQALHHYQRRISLGGWDEEVYYALLQAGRCKLKLGEAFHVVLESLTAAYNFRPSRLEAIYTAVRFCRENENYNLGYSIGKQALGTPIPDDILFVDVALHEWCLADELAVCSTWIGRKQEAKDMINKILEGEAIDPSNRKRVTENLRYC